MQILEVTMKPVAALNAAKYNPRKKLKPSDREYQDIRASIEEFGFCQNLVWNQRTKTLVGGHQRVLVAGLHLERGGRNPHAGGRGPNPVHRPALWRELRQRGARPRDGQQGRHRQRRAEGGGALSRADYHWAHEPCLYAGKPEQETPWFSEELRADWFWAHQGADYHWMHQPILYAAKDGGSTPWFGDRTQTTVWAEKRDSAKALIHPTQKPIGLARKAMANSTVRRDNVLDLFGGSGSTLIAAEMEGRNAYLMEQDPGWCDSIVTRYLNTFDSVEVYRNGDRVEAI